MRALVPVALAYFSYFAATGFHQPYFPIWLRHRGITDLQIGLVLAVPMFVRIGVAPMFGWVADRLGDRTGLIRVLGIGVVVSALLLGNAFGLAPIMVFAAATLVMWQGMSPLLDAGTIDLVRRGTLSDYGRIRLWGSASFILASLAGGFVLARGGTDAVFLCFTAVTCALAVATWLLPRARVRAKVVAAPARARGGRLAFFVILSAAALIQASHAAFNGYSSILLRSRGYADETIGAMWAIAAMSEIGMFWAGPHIARRIGPLPLLLLAATVAAGRWALFAFDLGLPVLVLLQLAQALTFSGTYLGLMRFIAVTVSEQRAGTVQGSYMTMQSLASAGTTLLTGALFQAHAGLAFVAAAGVALVAVMLLVGLRISLGGNPGAGELLRPAMLGEQRLAGH